VDKKTKIIIIGCGAGGGTAAQLARKTDRNSEITIFEKGKYAQYSKCGLPYVLSGEISSFNNLIEFSENWFEKENIKLYLNTSVTEINKTKHIVLAKRDNEQIKKEFDKLIIATGAKAFIPSIKNIFENNKLVSGVHLLRTMDDAKALFSELKHTKKASIIGAGLIGLEIADTLYKKGIDITIIESLSNILENTLDIDMSEPIKKELEVKTNLFTNHIASKIETENSRIKQIIIKNKETNQEKKIETDLLVIATGSKPEVNLAEKIGCKIGKRGGIIISEKTLTSLSNIYAVGDCTEYKDFVTNEPTCVGLGSIAVRHGIAAGVNAAGGEYNLPSGLLQTRTSEFFGFEVAAVGLVKNVIKNIQTVYGKFSGSSLPHYYPGGKNITIKVGVNEKNGEIVSAQAVGSNAAQRINVFACAIQNNVRVENLKKLETAYAPPIAPTLDVLTLSCDVAFLKYSRKKR